LLDENGCKNHRNVHFVLFFLLKIGSIGSRGLDIEENAIKITNNSLDLSETNIPDFSPLEQYLERTRIILWFPRSDLILPSSVSNYQSR
jgi:hypothetical protein